MKGFKVLFLLAVLFTCGIARLHAQIALQYSDTTTCPGQPLTMCASLTGQATNITVDDKYSKVIPLGFDFTYFGKVYNKCIISGNGMLTFDTTMADQNGANWYWGQASVMGFNGVTQANNSVMVTFEDLLPSPTEGLIRYQRIGQTGAKRFVVEWCRVPVFSGTCKNFIVTSQVILYEGSNNVEMYTTNLPPIPIASMCPSASGPTYYGQVVQGLRNDNGTASFYPPNRDPAVSATNWGVTGVTNDGMLYTPTGSATYSMNPIAFNPWLIIDSISSPDLKWYTETDPNLPIGTGSCVSVTTNANINYYVVNFTGNAGCDPGLRIFTDTVRVHFGTSYDTTRVEICAGTTYSWFGRNYFLAGNYDTLLHTALGCDSLLRLELKVNPLPDMTMSNFSATIGLCGSDSAVLALANPGPTTTYQWNRDGNPISGATLPKYTVTAPGVYDVTATTDKNCSLTSQKVTVTINPSPEAKIEPLKDEVICAYDTLELKAIPGNIAAGDYYDYRWSPEKPFRFESGSDGSKVRGVFLEPTEVVLTVYNKYGCYITDTTLVRTKPCCEVFAPNAFSPNGDGLNDYFNPQLQPGQVLVSLQIYDRYGKLVYNNTNIKKGWDGRYKNGSDAAAEVYMYLMKYTCADGKLYEKKESVTVLR
ncbi:gliding motility-associated C-terminal domain-containing protein [Taibaiella koreensis]|uniref:gliding motility-associated C-terminal domain-containing protein n=1 Tax=Taibaiella koreensis TaxID=1268548 RepID=UPI000E5999B1|nr:gliding motility-associated C-terminal domain-containing protein [Taibaiella koreensis]